MKPDISVIIVSFNTKKLTLSCVSSVVNENSSLAKEIIIVDNGSSDDSVIAIRNSKFAPPAKPLATHGKTQSSNVILIENPQNLGFAKANNQGIEAANGEYILLLNSDAIVKPGSIEKLVEFAKKDNSIGVVGPKLLNPNGTIQGSVFRQPTLIRTIRQYWLGKSGLLDKYCPAERDPIEVEVLSMAAFLITPQAKEKVGLLDERYFMYFEDFDYCRRAKKSGFKVYYYPDAEVIHRHGESGKMLASKENQWRRLIPSSKIYHGALKHYLLNCIIWTGQKWQKILR